ncbi:MAG: hypothetical protein IKW27_06610 [Bacteroidales bacterium]|nr:hypothetical protein [Bacteroidales bacterium]
MKKISDFVSGIEKCTDAQIREEMQKLTPAPVACVNWPDEFPYAPSVSVRVANSENALVLMFEVAENHIKAVAMENNGNVWEDSCVEFFVADPSGEGYYNFEVNCVGTVLASKRKSRTDAVHFTDEQIAQMRVFGSLEHKPTDMRGEDLKWWLVEVIPFSLFGLEGGARTIKANFYKCGDNCDTTHFLSWSPIGLPSPDFHCPAFFGEIELK